MNIFDRKFDEALGYDSHSFLNTSSDQFNIFDDEFDRAYEDSITMPYDDIIGSFMSRRSVEPFGMEQEEQEMGFGQIEPRIGSRAMPGSEFRVTPRTGRQDTAELGAITEVDRNVELFKQIGLQDEFESQVEAQNDSYGFDNIIEPIFDFLSVGNYTIAGGVEEYLLTNSPIAGLKQAGEEFLNAIGIDQEGARRTTWADVLSGKRGETALTIDKDSPFATAAGGFVLDVLLDPTTWFGFGLGKVAVGIGKIDEVAGAAMNTRRISDLVTNSEAGKVYRRMFMPNSLMKGLKEGYQTEEIADVINNLNREQGTSLVTADDIKEGAADFMANQIRKDAAVSMQTVALRENILKIAADMNEGELRLVGAYLDQPEVVEGLIKELRVDDSTKDVLRKGVEEWRDMFNEIFNEEEAVGLLDKAQFRANYSGGMEPITELSRAIVENMFKVRFGEDAGSAMYDVARNVDGPVTISENGIMKSSLSKKYPTLESRIQDLVPTETNAALMATRRGMESIKKVNTQKFYDTIVSDTRIAVPLDQRVAEDFRDPTHMMLKEHGMSIWKAPALSVRKQTKQSTGEESIYYAIPSAMKEQLDDMTKLMQGSDETNKLVSTFRQVQGLWKAYALLSPGYHMRNLYSNVFNNYLAGVTNPKRYAEAMLLQVGSTENIGSRAVRSKIERILGGPKSSEDYMFELPDGSKLSGAEVKLLADERGVTQAGMIYNESDLGIGEELMTNLQMRTGKPTTSEISEGLADWGDRGARIANVQASLFNAVRDAGGDLSSEQAQKTAEIYDVMARGWAWKNWKTPEEWYENRIREIKAFTVPTAGVPEPSLDFLHQSRFGPTHGPNVNTPEFKKAAEGAYAVDNKGMPLVVLRGDPQSNWMEIFSGYRYMDEVAERGNLFGPGIYTTEDFFNINPETQRFAEITSGYAGIPDVNFGGGVDYESVQKAEELLSKDKFVSWMSSDEKKKMMEDLQREGEDLLSSAQTTKSSEKITESTVQRDAAEVDQYRLGERLTFDSDEINAEALGRAYLTVTQSSDDFAKLSGLRISKEYIRETQMLEKLAEISNKQQSLLTIEGTLDYLQTYKPDVFDPSGGIAPLYNFIKNPWVVSKRDPSGRFFSHDYTDKAEITAIMDNVSELIKAEYKGSVDEVELMTAVGNYKADFIDEVFAGNIDRRGNSRERWIFHNGNDNGFKPILVDGDVNRGEAYSAMAKHIEWQMLDDPVLSEQFDVYLPIDAAKLFINKSLQNMGYDGITHAGGLNSSLRAGYDLYHQVFIAFNPSDIKSVYNTGSWDLGVNDLLAQHGEDGLYGAIQFLDDGRADLLATDRANPSTFIHEMAHLIRRTMLDEGDKDIVQRWILGEDAYNKVRPEAIRQAEEASRMAPNADIDIDEMATQLMERSTWNVDGEEKFARAFEQFLLEGVTDKNAGRAMQGTFNYMREMLGTVYDFSDGGKVGLTPNQETNYLLQNILGRGVETEPETMDTARAILETATSEKESLFSKAYGLLGDNMFIRANRNWGEQMENNSRLAHFITMMTTDKGKIQGNGLLKKKTTGEGMSADEAAQSVKRFLFDYGELTPFERDYMKTVIPFYTWMRKNIPLQFQMVAQRPERYSNIPKLQHALESMSPEWEGIPTPDYFDDINAVRMPVTSEALPLNDSGMPLYFAPDLPYGDLNRLNMKDMVSSMTPFIKTWAEIYPNEGYSFFLDSDIQDYQDQDAVAQAFGESFELPWNEKTWHAIKTLLPPVGKAARLGQRASEGKITEQALREVMGLNFRSVDVDAVVRAKRFQRREVSRAIKQRLIDKAKLMGFEDALEDMQDDDWF
jgi:hypothetical protein